ncbi:hypothetical protein HDU97_006635 [Phlyctochytrium planicorne]|nr:hypothetical protein HDU97_006635 [Phlyctochytrium planicorne]
MQDDQMAAATTNHQPPSNPTPPPAHQALPNPTSATPTRTITITLPHPPNKSALLHHPPPNRTPTHLTQKSFYTTTLKPNLDQTLTKAMIALQLQETYNRNDYIFSNYESTINAVGFLIVFADMYEEGGWEALVWEMGVYVGIEIALEAAIMVLEEWLGMPFGKFRKISFYNLFSYTFSTCVTGMYMMAGMKGIFGYG